MTIEQSNQTNSTHAVAAADALPACTQILPVILAGGSGTRLWPMSRENYPKQLIGVVGNDSLLQDTVQRMKGFPSGWQVSPSPIVVCGEEHRFVIAEQMQANGVSARLVVEPARRD